MTDYTVPTEYLVADRSAGSEIAAYQEPSAGSRLLAVTHDTLPVRISSTPIPRSKNPAFQHLDRQESSVSRTSKRSQLNRIARILGVPEVPRYVPPGVENPDLRKVYPDQLFRFDFVHWEDLDASSVQTILSIMRDGRDGKPPENENDNPAKIIQKTSPRLGKKRGEDYAPLSAKSRNAYRALFRGIAREAVVLGLMSRDTKEMIGEVRQAKSHKKPRGKAYGKALIRAALDACDIKNDAMHARDGLMFAVMVALGLRRAEVCHIEMARIDFETRDVHVTGKGNKDRTLKIPNGVWERLIDYLDRYRTWEPGFLFNGIYRGRDKATDLNRPLSVAAVNYSLERIKKEVAGKLGVSNISPHDFRRTYATNLLNAGMSMRAIQRLLGHASMSTTETYLFDSTTGYRDEAAQLLDAEYGKRQ
ncbi:tyrosine-type recombinase/integrase [Halomonas casei]|uniref:tyrosine-type recombinase/integrase n=1 Tax=Halomonas casei TaxID=2742613 RepID=UPI003CFA800C